MQIKENIYWLHCYVSYKQKTERQQRGHLFDVCITPLESHNQSPSYHQGICVMSTPIRSLACVTLTGSPQMFKTTEKYVYSHLLMWLWKKIIITHHEMYLRTGRYMNVHTDKKCSLKTLQDEGRGIKVRVTAYTKCHSQFHTNRSTKPAIVFLQSIS